MTIIAMAFATTVFGQDLNYQPIPEDLAERTGRICVQDINGRIKPIQTLATEILRKVSKKDLYDEQNGAGFYGDDLQTIALAGCTDHLG